MATFHQLAMRFSEPQSRVITAAQARALGISSSWLSRQIQAGHWQRLYQGVYVTHSGPLSWFARAHAALLISQPNAYLSHESAWFLAKMQPSPPRLITVSINRDYALRSRPGVKFFRRSFTPAVTGRLLHTVPEETVLDLIAQTRDRLEVIGKLTEGMRGGMHPNRVLAALSRRGRYRHRALVSNVLSEIEAGVESPLEHLYDDLERAHGLPQSRKQKSERVDGRWIRADRVFEGYWIRVELDGQLAHPNGRTNLDTWRDNAVMVKHGSITLRYRWHHIVGKRCETAGQIAAALRSRGWRGTPKRCGPNCRIMSYQVA